MGVRVFVIQRPISRDEVHFPLEPKTTGAILEYFHVVRAEEGGEAVRAMTYESADREELRTALMDLGKRVAQEYDLTDFECFRRIGEVPAGEACLLIRVAAPHSYEAFRAMNECLEQLRRIEISSQAVKA